MARRRNWLPLLAIPVWAVSWFVPVHRAGVKIGTNEPPGWQAFRLALFQMWPRPDAGLTEWTVAILAPASALTNFFFLVSVVLLLRRPAGVGKVVKWGLVVSVALNLWWFIFGMDRGDLRAGYYLWVASFVMLAVAAFRQRPAPEVPATGTPA